MHDWRKRVHGTTEKPVSRRLKWLLNHVSVEQDECLIWPFSFTSRGYPAFGVGRKQIGAHRYVCQLAHGLPPEGSQAAHSCGVPACVNPKHLRWATASENQADKLLHGTLAYGQSNAASKLTLEDVQEIKAAIGTAPQKVLAERYGVSQAAITFIATGRNWSRALANAT
jgi:hypothetical protein